MKKYVKCTKSNNGKYIVAFCVQEEFDAKSEQDAKFAMVEMVKDFCKINSDEELANSFTFVVDDYII